MCSSSCGHFKCRIVGYYNYNIPKFVLTRKFVIYAELRKKLL